MAQIYMKKDNLNARNAEFTQQSLTQPVFLNSVPKCGTHLLRNILRMFVPLEQQYHDTFIQIPNVHQHAKAAFSPTKPMLSWGHLLFSDESAYATAPARKLLLVRDPYSWVLARARFFISDNFEANLAHLKREEFTADNLINMMIFGIHGKAPTMSDIFTFNGLAWLGSDVRLVRFEELLTALKNLDSPLAKNYFSELLNHCAIDLPENWKERVIIGSDRAQSGTARENLTVNEARIPKMLTKQQKALVDFALPGARQILGYS